MREALYSIGDWILIGVGLAFQAVLIVLAALITEVIVLGGFCLIGNLVDWFLRAFVY